MSSIEIGPVLRIRDPSGVRYYLGTLQPAQIRSLIFVPVVTESDSDVPPTLRLPEKPGGYQRAGDPKRMERIKAFVMSRSECLIPPVVLSARSGWRFIPSAPRGDVGIIIVEDRAAVVDGQHRLGGLWRLAVDGVASEVMKQKPIPFMAVDSMSVEQETLEFVDINENQKGVKKSLIAWLEKDASFYGQAAHALAGDEESVFRGRIDIQYKRGWHLILFGAAKECVASMFAQQLRSVSRFDPESNPDLREGAIEITLKYWNLVSLALAQYWSDMELMPRVGQRKSKEYPGSSAFRFRLLEETGIRAFSRLAEKLFVATWIDSLNQPAWEAVEAALRTLGVRDRVRRVLTKPARDPSVLHLDPYLKSTGKAGVDAIYRHLESELLSLGVAHGDAWAGKKR